MFSLHIIESVGQHSGDTDDVVQDEDDDGEEDEDGDDAICGQRKARVLVYCIPGRGNIASSLERNPCVQNYHQTLPG